MKRAISLLLIIVMLLAAAALAEGWTCTGCGNADLNSAFCPNCGAARPDESWTCANCGAADLKSAFCPDCGAAKTAAEAMQSGVSASKLDVNPDYTGVAGFNKETGDLNVIIGDRVEIPAADSSYYLNFVIGLDNNTDETISVDMLYRLTLPNGEIREWGPYADEQPAGKGWYWYVNDMADYITMPGEYTMDWYDGDTLLAEKTITLIEKLTSKDPRFSIDFYTWSKLSGDTISKIGFTAEQESADSDAFVSPTLVLCNISDEPIEISVVTARVNQPEGSSLEKQVTYSKLVIQPGDRKDFCLFDKADAAKNFSTPGEYSVTWILNGSEIVTVPLWLLDSAS